MPTERATEASGATPGKLTGAMQFVQKLLELWHLETHEAVGLLGFEASDSERTISWSRCQGSNIELVLDPQHCTGLVSKSGSRKRLVEGVASNAGRQAAFGIVAQRLYRRSVVDKGIRRSGRWKIGVLRELPSQRSRRQVFRSATIRLNDDFSAELQLDLAREKGARNPRRPCSLIHLRATLAQPPSGSIAAHPLQGRWPRSHLQPRRDRHGEIDCERSSPRRG